MFVLAGCFLENETTASICWAMEAFKEGVGETHTYVRTIVTDEDAAEEYAVKRVMPAALHQLCTFHLQRNFRNHCSAVLEKPEYAAELAQKFENHWRRLPEAPLLAEINRLLQDHPEYRGARQVIEELLEKRNSWCHDVQRAVLTLGVHTTSYAESANHQLKTLLDGKCRLEEVLEAHFTTFRQYEFERQISDDRLADTTPLRCEVSHPDLHLYENDLSCCVWSDGSSDLLALVKSTLPAGCGEVPPLGVAEGTSGGVPGRDWQVQ
jgi:hypothetical protein